MPGIPDTYAETYLELKRLTDELHLMIESGEFYTLSLGSRRRRLRAVKRLYNRLVGPVAPRVLVGAVAAGVLLLAGCFQPTAQVPDDDGDDDGTTEPPPEPPAQVFVPDFSAAAQVNPYGIGLPDGYLFAQMQPVLADLDGDSDLDLVFSAERNGSPYQQLYHYVQYHQDGAVAFDPAADLGLYRAYNGYGMYYQSDLKTLVDIDGDGDLDAVLSGSYYAGAYGAQYGILLAKNNGSSFDPALHDTFSALGTAYAKDIAFADIDGDGDMDMLFIRESDGQPAFSLNNGDEYAPDFQVAVDSPYTDSDLPYTSFKSIEAADIDNDGDVDLLVGAYYDNYVTYVKEPQILFYENSGSQTAPSFAAKVISPFGLSFPGSFDWIYAEGYRGGLGVAAGDVDADGDLDLVVGPYVYSYSYGSLETTFLFFENTGTLQDVQ